MKYYKKNSQFLEENIVYGSDGSWCSWYFDVVEVAE